MPDVVHQLTRHTNQPYFRSRNPGARAGEAVSFALAQAVDGARFSRRPEGPVYAKTEGDLSLYMWDKPTDGVRFVLTSSDPNTDWGNGPNLELFDMFDRPGAQAGDAPNILATQGRWFAADSNIQLSGDSHSGQFSYIAQAPRTRRFRAQWEPTREVFISYCLKIPEGWAMPGAMLPGDYPNSSVWKIGWLYNNQPGVGGNGDVDVCLFTIPNGSTMRVSGNNTQPPLGGASNEERDAFWRWNQWMRFSFWLKAGDIPHIDPGRVLWQAISEGDGLTNVIDRNDIPIMPDRLDEIQYYRQLSLVGWSDPGRGIDNGDNVRALIDDVYIATGDRANNRIELIDNADYSNLTRAQFCQPLAWAPRRIEGLLRKGSIADVIGSTIHVTIGDEQRGASIEVSA
ncbi:MAG: hypothetical protein LAT50_13675 [Ectothiorhodospiraceae bacterium]|nr:hypothetical protein [Ectothiorhodospiraceae bacterium]